MLQFNKHFGFNIFCLLPALFLSLVSFEIAKPLKIGTSTIFIVKFPISPIRPCPGAISLLHESREQCLKQYLESGNLFAIHD